MLTTSLIIVCASIGAVMAQQSTTASDHITINTTATITTIQPVIMNTTTESTTTTTTTMSPSTVSHSSSVSAFEMSSVASINATQPAKEENCSACISGFQMIYLHPNATSVSYHSNMMINCSQALPTSNDSCYSAVRDNCSDVLNLLFTSNANLSFGLTCSNSGIRAIKWSDCPAQSPEAKMINDSNTAFCGFSNFSCSTDRNGILRINKIEVLEPLRKWKNCAPPVTTKPTIPLLPNPVGPSAITAIVVIICLFIVGVLAGFFFWPKCHMSEIPTQTPKKKGPPPVEAFNVAYTSPATSPTGAPNVSIVGTPGQFARGPAAA